MKTILRKKKCTSRLLFGLGEEFQSQFDFVSAVRVEQFLTFFVGRGTAVGGDVGAVWKRVFRCVFGGLNLFESGVVSR